jgi:multidrug resistance efflux pump
MPASPMEIANIAVIVLGATSSIVAAIAAYRNSTSSARRETKRIGLEEKRLVSQERFDEISVAERAQQMLVQASERQKVQIDELRVDKQQLRSEVHELKDSKRKTSLRLYNFLNDFEDKLRDFRGKTEGETKEFMNNLIDEIEEERNANGF